MGWIKQMSLKKALFTMILLGLLIATVISFSIFYGCIRLRDRIAPSGITIQLSKTQSPIIIDTGESSTKALQLSYGIEFLQIVLPMITFIGIIIATTILFYQIKLKEPLKILKFSAEQIQANNLEFDIKKFNYQDELTEVCLAFDKMKQNLYTNNQILWREAEERKRLNALFAHDLRNPVTVLKGTVKVLQRNAQTAKESNNLENKVQELQALKRLEKYTYRIECYIEAMSRIQKLEQMPLKIKPVLINELEKEIRNTIEMMDATISYTLEVPKEKTVYLDEQLFMLVTENLIQNTIRFANSKIEMAIQIKEDYLSFSIQDDGNGFPEELIKNGPKPFKQMKEEAHHFGLGLYSAQLLCQKHGGALQLENKTPKGAKVTALFKIDKR